MKLKKINRDKLYFTSDPHLHHKNIIEYCNRPYNDIIVHDTSLILNWNNKVPKDADVIVGGDFIFTSSLEHLKDLVNTLNGTIHLILGNHDYRNRLDRNSVKEIFSGRVYDVATLEVDDDELEDGKMTLFISHYPHMFWQRNTVHLHGHVHSGPNSTASEVVPFHPYRYDIGVDNNNYEPISYHELKVILTKRQLRNE